MSSQDKKREMPLSPHLQVYKPQITSVLSILHRFTGVVLYFGALLVVGWLICLSSGLESYQCFMSWLKSPLGYIVLMGWTFSLYYHLCNGIRHLAWDLGHGYDISTATRTGWLVVVSAFAFSICTWILGYMWGVIWS